ncbi:glycoside hydrolase family 2 protein [Peristeroidobacter agariperforans]|uniref:glycoside hydrolase family 2 protein n=1 Tax=Peristeroidobacter agariperforans TaxID=268404 RepID=UPI0018E55452|nr:sugar-binding domain-containing protein [Peristeroidobacter agariperforans]
MRMMTKLAAGILIGIAGLSGPMTAQTAAPTSAPGASYVGPIVTKWGKAVTPENAWQSYPRPQLERPDWLNLNGSWDYAITKAAAAQPKQMDGKILVPFAVESKLSGVARKVLPNERLWYRRSFTVPPKWKGKRTILHFGAVDYESQVFINGAPVGAHRGGSDPFSYDITEYLKSGANELVVHVSDPTSTGDQPRGKQTLDPQGIWYTAVTGIWQTVWLEAVPDLYIKDVRATPDIDRGVVSVEVALNAATSNTDAVRLTASANGKVVASTLMRGNRSTTLAIPEARLWSPSDPFLYDLTAELVKIADIGVSSGRDARIPPLTTVEQNAYAAAKVQSDGGDKVTTYFGMRKISVGPNAQGRPVLLLNNKPLFQNGTLDQGWWPDGLLTPPSEEAARSDMVFLQKAGFNMLRKHIKVEPARYYYDADRLGMLIWQDMPSGSMADQSVRRQSDREATFSSTAMAEHQSELARMIGALRAFPSIVMWVTNNEGWGQYGARTMATLAKNMDPSRLVNAASGWMDVGDASSEIFDIHTYEEVPTTPVAHGPRALVVGEYGGVGLAVRGHLWFPDRDLKIYQVAQTPEDYLARYKRKFEEIIRQAKEAGVSAAVYTQTTDVESELNGLLTYDREVEKFPAATFAEIARPLFDTP